MHLSLRKTALAVAAAAGAGALALSAPGMSSAPFLAGNADKVDGLDAVDLTKIQYYGSRKTFDDFDTCAFTTIMSRTFKTTHTGVVAVDAQVSAARDTDFVGPGVLSGRILIDGLVSSLSPAVQLDYDGNAKHQLPVFGARKVGQGNHSLELQVEECGGGRAFITDQAMTATYSPFGGAKDVAIRPVVKRNLNN
jgi:hypothetical protein